MSENAQAIFDMLDQFVPPETSELWGDIAVDVGAGYSVTVFYDAGELDYIDHIQCPDGSIIWVYGNPRPSMLGRCLRGWGRHSDVPRLRQSWNAGDFA